MNDHIPDVTKMISDTPRMHSALMDVPDAGFANIWKVGCEIERELNAANERIKRLEEALERLFNLPNDCCCQLSNSSLDAWNNAHEALKAMEAKP